LILIAIAVLCTAAETGPIKVIVFPLNGSSQSESIAWVGKGIAESLSSQLRSQQLDVMDSDRLAELTEHAGFMRGRSLSRGSMIRIAQQASADLAVMGSFKGTEKSLGISVRVFYLEDFKLSGSISANCPLSVLPQMENEIAWQILTEIGQEGSASRQEYSKRARKIPNSAFKLYIQALDASGPNDRVRLLQKAADIYENFPEAHFQLGKIFYQKADCKRALSHLKQAGDKVAAPMEAHFMAGTCYTNTNQPALAVETYSLMIRNSRSFEILNNLGVAYLRQGRNAEALNMFSEACTLAPANPVTSLNLAIVQLIQDDIPAALSLAAEAIAAHPDNGMLHFLRGFLLDKQGEKEKAEADFQEAVRQGIAVQKLLAVDPKEWARVFTNASFLVKQSAGRQSTSAD
jgi:tetratricopeptide (TPR) repeat protein